MENNNITHNSVEATDNSEAILALRSSAAACLFLAAALEANEEKTETTRTCWIKDYRKSRKIHGDTQNLLMELKPNSADYKNFLRMDEACFNFILSAIRADIQKENTFMRQAITPEEKLAVTLRFLATGESYQEFDYNTKLSKSFLSEAIMDVCDAIYIKLKGEFLKFPTSELEWSKIASDYSTRWQFPQCLGALDGKHIRFRPAKSNAPLFYNYKGFHSIVLLGLADAHSKFIFIDVGCNGRISDGGVLQRSDFMYILQQPEKHLPSKTIIGNNRLLPYVYVADNAFPLSEHLMTPYPFTTVDENKKTFNRRLSRARQTIERAFGILTNRFTVLQKPINLREDKVKKIVLCCCVLHNFLITKNQMYKEIISVDDLTPHTPNPTSNINSKTGEAVRQA